MADEYSPNATLFVLNRNFVQFYAISEFVSLIWTERYWSCGDFELELLYDLDVLNNVKVGHYITLGGSENIMVIESLAITYEIDNKSARYIVYKGRTMESILDRRIVWGEWLYEDIDAQSIILDLIEKCITAPEDANRKISFFRAVSNDQIPEYKLTLYGDGDVLYEIIQAICQEKQIGMRCRLIESAKVVEFSLYSGLDHSYDQLDRAPVIFSGEYENLGPSRYALDTSKYKTCALVVSPWRDTTIRDEDGNVVETETTRSVVEVGDFSLTGLDRREMLVESGSGYPDDMVREAMEEIADINRLEELDSELDPKRQFVYGVDYDIGDTVQVVTEFGLDAKAIVIEFIRSWSSSGYTEVPTFKIIDGNNHILSGDDDGEDGKEPEKPPEPLFIDIPTVVSSFVYNGREQSVKLSNYDEKYIYLAGTTHATNAGYYLIYAVLRDPNNFWTDYTNEPKLIGWTIQSLTVKIPSLVEASFDYNGKSVSPIFKDFDPNVMVMTGTVNAIRPGDYTIGIVLDSNCQWTDGTNSIKYYAWKINKVAGSITLLNSDDVSLDDNIVEVMVPFIFTGGQPIISSISNLEVVSAEIIELDRMFYIKIMALSNGECDIRVHTEENDLYFPSEDVNVHIISTFGLFVLGKEWTEMGLPSSKGWRSVAYGGGRFVVVAENSQYGAYSDDGIKWFEMELPASRTWSSIGYGDEKFVAVADGSQYAAYSNDGIKWFETTLPSSRYWWSVAYGGGRFVAVAINSQYGAYSDDGIEWFETTLPSSRRWYSVAYGGGRFVAIVYNQKYAMYSDDGIKWFEINISLDVGAELLFSVAYGGGRFVAVDYNTRYAIYSDDGLEWFNTTLPSIRHWRSVAYGGGRFVAVGDGSQYGAYSNDGIKWFEMELPMREDWWPLAYGGGRFVTMSYGTRYGAYSGDLIKEEPKYLLGRDWFEVPFTKPYNKIYNLVAYGDGKFVVAATDSSIIYYTVDGLEWNSLQAPGGAKSWTGMVYGNGKFILVAYDGDAIAYSSDGIVWNMLNPPVSASWQTICYGDLGFVILSRNSYGLYSQNGIEWSVTNLPMERPWTGIRYGNGRFIAFYTVSWSRYTELIQSDDGIHWEEITSSILNNVYIRDILYDGEKFVAFGESAVYFSSDGSDWIEVASLPKSDSWKCGYGSGIYILVSYSDTIALYSNDAINWTEISVPYTQYVYRATIAYGNERFIILPWTSDTDASVLISYSGNEPPPSQ